MKKNKVLAIILVILLLIKNTITFAKVINIGETKYLERGDQGFYSIQYWNNYYQRWYYVTYSRTFFTDNEGKRRIAYCCTPDANGIGWIPGEYEGYDTTIQYKLSNEDEKQKKLWRVFKNGYPYVSPEKIGVETEDDAYLATKQAAYFIIRDKSENEVYEYFRPGEDYVEGQELDETYRRGKKVIDAIYNLVYIGNNGSEKINAVDIIKKGEIQKDGEYSYQEYEILGNSSEEKITINDIEDCPNKTKIVNESGEEKNVFYSGEKFKIVFKNTEVIKDYNILIKYTKTCKNYPVFYAKSSIEDTQDYLLTADRLEDEEGVLKLDIKSDNCKIKIKKINDETKDAIGGVKFKVEYKNGEKIGEYYTDKNGIIVLEKLKPQDIIITEIETLEEFILNTNPIECKLCFNETEEIEIGNKKKEIEKTIEIKKEEKIKKLPRTGY